MFCHVEMGDDSGEDGEGRQQFCYESIREVISAVLPLSRGKGVRVWYGQITYIYRFVPPKIKEVKPKNWRNQKKY